MENRGRRGVLGAVAVLDPLCGGAPAAPARGGTRRGPREPLGLQNFCNILEVSDRVKLHSKHARLGVLRYFYGSTEEAANGQRVAKFVAKAKSKRQKSLSEKFARRQSQKPAGADAKPLEYVLIGFPFQFLITFGWLS